jgi:hypothetical protein
MRAVRSRAVLLALVAATAIVSSVAAAGCGSSSVATLDPVAQAADVTAHAGGAHLALAAQVQADGLSQPVVISGEGFFNYSSEEGKFSLDLTGLPASAAAALPSGQLHMEEILKSSAVYVASPLFAGRLPAGARWVKLDLGRLRQAAGLNLQQLVGGQSNPAQFLQYLRATGGNVKAVGSDAVRGVPTTHYTATIDLSKVADVAPTSDRGQLRAALQKLIEKTGVSQIPVDAWVDAHRLVRRIAMTLTIPAGSRPASFHLTVDLFDFGSTPTVSAPAASDTYDATGTALSGLSASGG